MTANTATARMATKTTKSKYFISIYTRLLGSKEAFFYSLRTVTATVAKTDTVNKISVLYENIHRIYSKNSHSKHIIYVSISAVSAVSTVSAVSAGAVQKKTI